MNFQKFVHSLSVVLLILFLVGCSAGPVGTSNEAAGSTPGAALTEAPLPTETVVVIPTPTFPASTAPVTLDPPIPQPQTPISADNASQVSAMGQWEFKDVHFAVSPNGAFLAIVPAGEGQTKGVYVYDLVRSAGLWFLSGESTATPVFSPDSSKLVDGSGQVWDTKTGTLGMKFSDINPENSISYISFSGDGSKLAASTKEGLQMWNLADGTIKTIVEPKSRGVYAIALSPDGSILAVAYDQDKLTLFNSETGEEISQFDYGNRWISSLAFSPDGKYIAAGATDGKALILLTSSLEILQTLNAAGTFWVTGLAFSPDGTILVTGELQTMKLWKVSDGSLLADIEIDGGFQDTILFASDGKSIVMNTLRENYVLEWFGIP